MTEQKASHVGTLSIATGEMPCAVLEDGTRVLSQGGVIRALGQTKGGRRREIVNEKAGAQLPLFLASSNLIPFIDGDLLEMLNHPIKYRHSQGGGFAHGFKAEVLPRICDVWLKARDKGALRGTQEKTARNADLIIRGLAHVGIIALVDEATGYQEVRDKKALQAILDKYLLKEQAKWAKRFPDEFYQEMFRLRGWQWKGMKVNRPSIVGHYTNDLVYERLAPGILKELKQLNPPDEKGNRKAKHTQFLTDDVGHPALQRHLLKVITLMEASPGWAQFQRSMARVLPKLGEQIPLALED